MRGGATDRGEPAGRGPAVGRSVRRRRDGVVEIRPGSWTDSFSPRELRGVAVLAVGWGAGMALLLAGLLSRTLLVAAASCVLVAAVWAIGLVRASASRLEAERHPDPPAHAA